MANEISEKETNFDFPASLISTWSIMSLKRGTKALKQSIFGSQRMLSGL